MLSNLRPGRVPRPMRHVILIALHFVALLFGAAFLFVTIPAHLIYATVRKKRDSNAPTL